MDEVRSVVVIGGTSGIGKAIAQRFAAEGANVVISGRDETRGSVVAKACSVAGGKALFLACDLTHAESIAAMAERAAAAFGTPHVLVNSGVDHSMGSCGTVVVVTDPIA